VTTEDRLPPGVVRVRAANPSPMTLDGTNSYVVAGWVVDPGPNDPAHLERVRAAAPRIEGIVLTHAHGDHADGAVPLSGQTDVPVLTPHEGEPAGPFEVVATPGHSPDSVCLIRERVCFTGDTVLGYGSVFVAPGDGSLASYLDSLRRLLEHDLEALCPGHGPVVWDPHAKLTEYLDHRLEREHKLVEALDSGARSEDELLDHAWSDVPAQLRPAAAVTLAAHLEKLRDEGRLPADLERG
jgi:glyoxylase-like metal-dependent hydrolase (beta-lactamase superfamily II)